MEGLLMAIPKGMDWINQFRYALGYNLGLIECHHIYQKNKGMDPAEVARDFSIKPKDPQLQRLADALKENQKLRDEQAALKRDIANLERQIKWLEDHA